jgi:hypothetical protein
MEYLYLYLLQQELHSSWPRGLYNKNPLLAINDLFLYRTTGTCAVTTLGTGRPMQYLLHSWQGYTHSSLPSLHQSVQTSSKCNGGSFHRVRPSSGPLTTIQSLKNECGRKVKGRLLGLSAALRLLVSRLYPWPPMSSLIHLQRRLVPHRHERPQAAKEGTIQGILLAHS